MHQPILQEQPFVKFVLPLIIGILLQGLIALSFNFIVVFLIIFLLIFGISFLFKDRIFASYLSGLSTFLIFFSLGILVSNIHQVKNIRTNESIKRAFVAQLVDVPVEKGNSYQAKLHLVAKYENNLWLNYDQKILAYFRSDSLISILKAGSEIIFNRELKEIDAPKNPFDFNFKRYLALKDIQYTVFLKSGDWIPLSDKEKGIRQFALNIREKLVEKFEEAGIKGEQLAVFSALTLGYKNKLDAKLRNAYSGAGAMHVLAVSGMHVGIVYLVLDWFFKLITFFNRKIRLKYLLIILLLWAYALVTGLSTSVLRSTIMFTFILFGYLFNKKANVYNSLAASALLLLLINPNYLFEVGFQLSYVAVAGIVFFYPKIYKLIYVPTKLLNGIWQLTVVSLAAQLATFPISIFYFKQFATYFWLSNIVVSASATILLFSAILLVVCSPFTIVSGHIGNGINNFVELINSFVYKVNTLPFSVIDGIKFNYIHVVLIYIIIAFFVSWLMLKKVRWLLYSLVLLFALIIYQDIDYINKSKRSNICVYNLPKASAMHLIKKHSGIWIIKNETSIDSSFMNKANDYWRIDSKLDSEIILPGSEYFLKENFLAFSSYRVLIVDESTRPFNLLTNDSIKLDFVLVRGNPSIKMIDLPKNIVYKNIVVDGSVPPWISNKWLNQENVCVHNTRSNGMFLMAEYP